MKRFSISLLIGLITVLVGTTETRAQFAHGEPVPAELAEGFNSINTDQAKEWLGVLAGPIFEGRGSGQAGYTKAAHWVAGKIAEMGLEPAGEHGTYFQMLPFTRKIPIMSECFISGPQDMKINGVGNFGFDRMTDAPETTGEVVIINFSGNNPSLAPELELRDKIIFYVVDDGPAAARVPNLLARKRVAAAIRVITGEPKSISQVNRPGGRRRSSSISGTITIPAAKKILESVGGQPQWLAKPETEGVDVYPTTESLSISIRTREEPASIPNVVAWLEGSDPTVNHEYVVIGSHLDHLGIRNGTVHPGADDNGSGSTAVLSIANAFTENGNRPRRSVLFMWFAAEEIGLVGSRHYTDNPLKPLENMTCMFNIDMVGRNEETKDETSAENEGAIHLVGSKKGESDIHEIVEAANKHDGFRFEYDEEDVFGRSDQYNFFKKGVPVAFLFGGFHPDYHQPSDKVGKINFDKIVAAAKLYYIAINLASEHGHFEMKKSQSAQ